MAKLSKSEREAAIAAEKARRATTKDGGNGKSNSIAQIEAPKTEESVEGILDEEVTQDEDEKVLEGLESAKLTQEKIRRDVPISKEEIKNMTANQQHKTENEIPELLDKITALEEISMDQEARIHDLEKEIKELANFRDKVAVAVRQTLELEVSRVVSEKIEKGWASRFKAIAEDVKCIKDKYNQVAEATLYIPALQRLDAIEEKISQAERASEKAEKAKVAIFEKIKSLPVATPAPETKPELQPQPADILG